MPSSDTNVPHVAFTHHRIGIHDERSAKAPDAKAAQLAPVLDVAHLPAADRDRTLGLAYMRLAVDNLQNEKFAFYSSQSEELLRRAAAEGISDPATLAALSIHDKASGDLAAARQRAEAALADPAISPSDRIVATHALATLFAQEQQFSQARPLAEQLTQWRAEPGDWLLLAACRSQMRDLNGAIAALDRAIDLDPTMVNAYPRLAELYQARGEAANAQELIERMRLIEARLK
jgi:tetratricopeptide (TPR) repeat protein